MEWWNFTVTSDLLFMFCRILLFTLSVLLVLCVHHVYNIILWFFIIFMMMLVFPLNWILSYPAAHPLTFPLGLDVQQSSIHSFMSYVHLCSICVTSLSFDISTLSLSSPWSPQWLFIEHFCALMESYCLSHTVHFYSPVYLLCSTFLLL
jgi:hypothetical protein